MVTRLRILGPLAGSNQATAILAGSKQVNFKATGIDNNVPVFTEINNISVNETQVVEFEVKATDPDNDPIGYSALSLPNGASFAATTDMTMLDITMWFLRLRTVVVDARNCWSPSRWKTPTSHR